MIELVQGPLPGTKPHEPYQILMAVCHGHDAAYNKVETGRRYLVVSDHRVALMFAERAQRRLCPQSMAEITT